MAETSENGAYEDARRVLDTLESEGYRARLAGGCVRDRHLGINPKDYDVATDAHPHQVMKIFKARRRKVVPTGIDHGTVTVVMPSGPVEITTLREDVETDGRYATVHFGRSFAHDAARRDFTINAMFEDRNGEIHDYFGGLNHIKQRRLCFVGEADGRIREDYLRILRLFRFWARFGFEPDEATLAAVRDLRKGLQAISQERITSEIWALLEAPHFEDPLASLAETSVLSEILPEAYGEGGDPPDLSLAHRLRELAPQWRALALVATLFRRWMGASDPSEGEEGFERLGRRLKLSKARIRALRFFGRAVAVLRGMSLEAADALDFVDACEAAGGAGAFECLYHPTLAVLPLSDHDALVQRLNWIASCEKSAGERRRADLPVNGHDVAQTLNLKHGPELGTTMEQLKRAFRNGEWATRDQALEWLRHYRSTAASR